MTAAGREPIWHALDSTRFNVKRYRFAYGWSEPTYNRIYLMGHSLGGGGALHLGEKYSTIWAAVAGLAPAAFGFQWSADQNLKNVPLLIIVGDQDRLVAGSQQLADQLKSLNFQVEYKSLPGLDHGGIIGGSMPDVFRFFNRHTRRSFGGGGGN